ncbi:MAG: hypothetical protein JWO03_646 [Bacteroidetes bacterium]|nr:hypothetical protein [Bacteroidota bacterium]
MSVKKISLSEEEFKRALISGKAFDGNGFEHSFEPKDSIPGSINIKNAEIANVSLLDLKIDKMIFISNCDFDDIRFMSCEFTDILGIHNCTFKKDFALGNSTFNLFDLADNAIHSFWASHSTIKTLNIRSCVVGKHLAIWGNSLVNSLHISDCDLSNKLQFSGTPFDECKITNCKFTVFEMPSIKEKAILKLIDITIDSFNLGYDFNNLGYIQWNTIQFKADASIIIKNAVMNKWDIINCDLSQTKLIIYSSKIIDTFYTNTKFPDKLCVPDELKQNQNEHEIRRDGYNQLKTIAQKQNDRKMFLHYQAAELESYYKTVRWNENFPTWFQLFAMKWSNNFGTKWTWGAIFVLVSNFIFVAISFGKRGWQIDGDGIGNFLSGYLSSLSSLISVPKYFISNWEVNWFYIGRIPLAFGIYQTIAAFRKFGKSE